MGGLLFYGIRHKYIYLKKDMIYLNNTSTPQGFFVPKNGTTPPGDLVFKAKSTVTLKEEVSQAVTDLRTSEMFFSISITLPANVPSGEYAYTLLAGNTPVSIGILIIGETFRPTQHNTDITYKEYETE